MTCSAAANRSTWMQCCGSRGPESLPAPPPHEFRQQVTLLPLSATRWLAELYGTLRETPYPGQSELAVWPHPWLPNVYTVPFLDGRLVYAVLEGDERGLVKTTPPLTARLSARLTSRPHRAVRRAASQLT